MNTVQIEKCLYNYPYFKGVYAKDKFIFSGTYPSCYVINTGLSDTPGEHWIAIWVDTDIIYYFDSLGMSPSYDVYIMGLVKSCRVNMVTYNTFRIQGLFSNVCGCYSIVFIHEMHVNPNFKNFLSNFNSCRQYENDSLVCKIMKNFCFTDFKCII